MNSPEAMPLKDAFLRARDLIAEEREQFMSDIARSDPGMASKLKRMLLADRAAAGPLELSQSAGRQPGEMIAGRYRIVRRLESNGSLSEVYLAGDTSLHDRRVAIKFPKFEHWNREWLIEQFQRETQALAAIEHPHVVRIYDSGLHEREPFLVMEFIEGRTLREAMGESRASKRVAVARVQALASALDEAHRHGVLHLDIKPSNVILRNGGEPVLIDFGVAQTASPDRTAAAGTVAGSMGYMAPEHRNGRPCVASDIYSLGVLSWELLTGKRPEGQTRGLPRCIRKALHEDSRMRHATAGQFAASLRRHIEWPRRLKSVAALVAACSVAGAGAWYLQRPAEPIEVRSFLSLPGSESLPSASRDGNRIAFLANHDGNDEVYLWDRRRAQPIRLTQTPHREDSPSVSPDGEHVAYIRRGGGLPALMVQKAEADAAPRVLLQDRALQDVNWHTSGKWLMIAAGQPAGGSDISIAAISVENGEFHDVAICKRCKQGYPAVSPDGRWLAFTQGNESSSGALMVVALKGEEAPVASGVPRAVYQGQDASEPAWALDGKSLFYECAPHICRVGITPGSIPEQVLLPRNSLRNPHASPQGLLLADRPRHWDIWRKDLSTGESVSLFRTAANERSPAYSPDGRWIAFLSDRLGPQEVWLADARTLASRQLTSYGGIDAVAWSPDSSALFITSAARNELAVLNATDGGILHRWAAPPEFDAARSSPVWSNDGRLYIVLSPQTKGEIAEFRIGREGMEKTGYSGARELASIPGRAGLLVRKAPRELVLLDALQKETLISTGIARSRLAASQRGVYFARYLDDSGSWLFFHRFGGDSAAEKIFRESSNERWGYGLSVSPDGRSLLYTRENRANADLVIAPEIR